MVGRPRLAGERSPVTGRLKQTWRGSEAPLRRQSELERLLAKGLIERRHLTVARQWAGIVGQHDRVISAPVRTSRSPDYEAGRSGKSDGDGYRCRGCDGQCEAKCSSADRVKGQWDRAKAVLGSSWSIAYDVVLLDFGCDDVDARRLRDGLERLAQVWDSVGK
ncbi:hypothetical protein HPT29_028360 (plasmid) [Microvirga terrae]|uniref:Uncharacterized protein n=1 Tax=Microvirga terrae TaxID=2740529 RepID=A0ABY5S4H9_9HYPH|nr:hypothetical protein [Microvirga terrae]UVF22867.1 hypothetical protein HPT29_028360 [Microvirga terrae]